MAAVLGALTKPSSTFAVGCRRNKLESRQICLGQIRLQSQSAFGGNARFFAAFQFEEPFRQAAEKDRLVACGPQFSLPHRCFPRHEIIERSSSFILNKFDDTCVIDEAEKRGLIRNQIEWVH
jgi:hypothetical protein